MVNWTKWLGGRGSEGREECRLAERREESERSAIVLTQPLQSVWLQVAARHSDPQERDHLCYYHYTFAAFRPRRPAQQ